MISWLPLPQIVSLICVSAVSAAHPLPAEGRKCQRRNADAREKLEREKGGWRKRRDELHAQTHGEVYSIYDYFDLLTERVFVYFHLKECLRIIGNCSVYQYSADFESLEIWMYLEAGLLRSEALLTLCLAPGIQITVIVTVSHQPPSWQCAVSPPHPGGLLNTRSLFPVRSYLGLDLKTTISVKCQKCVWEVLKMSVNSLVSPLAVDLGLAFRTSQTILWSRSTLYASSKMLKKKNEKKK